MTFPLTRLSATQTFWVHKFRGLYALLWKTNRFRTITILMSILKRCFQTILWHKLMHVEKWNPCTWQWVVSCHIFLICWKRKQKTLLLCLCLTNLWTKGCRWNNWKCTFECEVTGPIEILFFRFSGTQNSSTFDRYFRRVFWAMIWSLQSRPIIVISELPQRELGCVSKTWTKAINGKWNQACQCQILWSAYCP